MSEKKKTEEEKFIIDSLEKNKHATTGMQKLNKDPISVSVYRHTSQIQQYELERDLIDQKLKGAKDNAFKKELESRQSELTTALERLYEDKLEGQLTTLSYRDINDIKAAITEAVIHFREYKFDSEVIMGRVVAEERFMTIFCALKRKDNDTKRYFENLESITEIDDATIFDLYDKWEHAFVLTEQELKN